MSSRSVFVVGAVVTILGLIMIPAPGPGTPIVALGSLVLLTGVVVSAANRRRSSP
jgi:hypothetical protein